MRSTVLLGMLLVAAAPAAAQPRAGRAAELDGMIAALKAAPTAEIAGQIEARLRQFWVQAASPTAALLLNRGARDLNNAAADDALDDFDAALALDPDLPEGFHRRAMARDALGDYRGAVADIEEALKREPRFFPAWQTLSRIAEEQKDYKGALAAWKKALELSPHTPDGAQRTKVLERKAYGEGT